MMNKSSLQRPPGDALNAGKAASKIEFMISAPGLRPLVLALCLLGEKPAFAAPTSGAEIPVARFTDISHEAGITFTHVNGAYGDKLLPETMGGGVAFFDCDNDGCQDLLFIN